MLENLLISWFPCLLVCMAPAAPGVKADDADSAALAAKVGASARVTQTKHFTVAYDTSDAAVRTLTARLEATYQSVETYCKNNGLPFAPPPSRLEILFFEQLEGFYAYGRGIGFDAQGFNGFYHTGTNRSAFFNVSNHPGLDDVHRELRELELRVAALNSGPAGASDRAAKREALDRLRLLRNQRDRFVERLNRAVIQHEAVHQLLYNVGVHVRGARNPQWFIEGMACLFETPPSERGAGIGTTNQFRLADFRKACARESATERLKPEDLARALEKERFVPLKRMVSEPTLFQNTAGGNLSNMYAQAWSLAFFLQRTQGKKLADYAARITRREFGQEVSGEEELKLFESVFGPVDAAFERRWAKFILDLAFIPDAD